MPAVVSVRLSFVYRRKFRGLLEVARESMEGGDVCAEYMNVSTAKYINRTKTAHWRSTRTGRRQHV